MLLHDSRRAARFADGELVPLAEQDRAAWDHDRIAEGRALLDRALAAGARGPYAVQAAIAELQTRPGRLAVGRGALRHPRTRRPARRWSR
jgi:RNA polymerase sigma-70 factor (ECF subfamily)